jgi:hypothetical protein
MTPVAQLRGYAVPQQKEAYGPSNRVTAQPSNRYHAPR